MAGPVFLRDIFANNAETISVSDIVMRCASDYANYKQHHGLAYDVVIGRLKDIEYPRGVKLIGGALNAAFEGKEFHHSRHLERNDIRRSDSIIDITNAFVDHYRSKGKQNPRLCEDLMGMRYDDAIFTIGAGYHVTREKYCLSFR